MASIERRERNGKITYSARFRDPSGASKRKVFDRLVDAKQWMHENETSKAKGAYVDPSAGRTLFGEQAARWFTTKAASKPATRKAYRQCLGYAGAILDDAGKLDLSASTGLALTRLDRIDTMALREWQATLTASGKSASRVRNAMLVVRQVLTSAIESGKLARNAATGIKAPKSQRAEMHFLEAPEVERLADTIDPRYRAMVLLSGWTGLRACEITALRIKDLDMLRSTVRVREGATEVDGKLEWGAVKNYEARTVRMPASVRDELAAYLAQRPYNASADTTDDPKDPSPLVFTSPEGRPHREGAFMARIFRPAVTRAGLVNGLRFHDLRHSAASVAIREVGADILTVSKMLGHKDASITLTVYGHLYPSSADALADRLDEVRRGSTRLAARVDGGPTVAPAPASVASSQVTTLPTVRNAG